MIRIFTLLLGLLFSGQAYAATAISASGTYGAGDYYLSSNVSANITSVGSYAGAINFSGTATLDIQGKTLSCTGGPGTGGSPIYSVGVKSGSTVTIFDSIGTGKITGCRWGTQLTGSNSKVLGVDFTGNLYIGVGISGANSLIEGNLFNAIGGVHDEPYAIGVQNDGAGVQILGNTFLEFYTQSAYTQGGPIYEGIPINCASAGNGCIVKNNIMINDTVAAHTICMFLGTGGNALVENNTCVNFQIAYDGYGASGSLHEYNGNVAWLKEPIAGSRGFEGGYGEGTRNLIIGYETPIYNSGGGYADYDLTSSTILTGTVDETDGFQRIDALQIPYVSTGGSPGGPCSGWCDVFTKTLATNMGPWSGQTYAGVIKAASLGTLPVGSQTEIEITFEAGAGGFGSGAAYICHRSTTGGADPIDCASAPAQLMDGGSGTFSVPANGTKTVKATFAYNGTSDLVIAIQHDASGANNLKAYVDPGSTNTFKGYYMAGNQAATQNKTMGNGTSGFADLGGSAGANQHCLTSKISMNGF